MGQLQAGPKKRIFVTTALCPLLRRLVARAGQWIEKRCVRTEEQSWPTVIPSEIRNGISGIKNSMTSKGHHL